MEDKIEDIYVQVDMLESLARILLESIREGDNLKPFDAENLAKIVLLEIINIKAHLDSAAKEMKPDN